MRKRLANALRKIANRLDPSPTPESVRFKAVRSDIDWLPKGDDLARVPSIEDLGARPLMPMRGFEDWRAGPYL